jgi:predicted nucleotidyltransferase
MILDARVPDHAGTVAEVVESYYLETKDGLFFAVKGFEHPPDRWIGVVRYAPDPGKGDRRKEGRRYRRLYGFAEQEQLIRAAFPQYATFDPVFQTTLQSVPRARVQRIYDPRLRLRELLQAVPRKGLEEDARAFIGMLQSEAAVPQSCFGVTGSLLIGLHTELSDLDIAVFGTQNCHAVSQALRRLLGNQAGSGLRRLDTRDLEELYVQRTADTYMAFDDFVSLEKRKVNQGRFRERTYFARFIKEAHEAGGNYGDRRYLPLGPQRIGAQIADDRESLFTPCRYLLCEARSPEGSPLPDLKEIVSFRGRFCEQARAGDSILAKGTLERVQNRGGDTWHRLLLGNSSDDTMLVRHPR